MIIDSAHHNVQRVICLGGVLQKVPQLVDILRKDYIGKSNLRLPLIVVACPGKRYAVILEFVAAIAADEFANNGSSMGLSDRVYILSDAVGSLHQDSFVPDGKVPPLAVQQILISFNFLPVEILTISVGSSTGQGEIRSSAIEMGTSRVGSANR